MKGKSLLLISLLMTGFFGLSQSSIAEEKISAADLEKGKEIAFDRRRGNCLACHYIQGGALMGTTGPGLVAMKQRFPDKDVLIAQISDARIKNKNTIMPPFGAHGILTKEEIELVVDWLYTL